MKKTFIIILSLLAIGSCEVVNQATGVLQDMQQPGLTESEIVQGLKEALKIGLDNSVKSASSDGGYLKSEFIKIILPKEVKDLKQKIDTESVLGGTVPLKTLYNAYIKLENNNKDLFNDLVVAMNKGAEKAAPKAGSIFLDAILKMSFSDAKGILDGNETSATQYFYKATNTALFDLFRPTIKDALDNTKANQLYGTTVGFLNYKYDPTGLGLKTVSPKDVLDVNLPDNIDEYATNKAIDGLFYLIGEEEKKIRKDPFAWGSAIIERVFGSKKN